MFHLIQAAHDEAAALRNEVAYLLSLVRRGEQIIESNVAGIESRVAALFGHTSAAVAALPNPAEPRNTANDEAAPDASLDTSEAEANSAAPVEGATTLIVPETPAADAPPAGPVGS